MKYKLQIEFDILDENLDGKMLEIIRNAYIVAEEKKGTPEYGSVPFMHLLPKEIRNADASVVDIQHNKYLNDGRNLHPYPMDGEVNVRIVLPNLDLQTIMRDPEFEKMTARADKPLYALLLNRYVSQPVAIQEAKETLRRIFRNDYVKFAIIREVDDAHGYRFDGVLVPKTVEQDANYPLNRVIQVCNVRAENIIKLGNL